MQAGVRRYVWDLVSFARWAIMTLAVTLVAIMGLTTIDSIYRGERRYGWRAMMVGTATVGQCSRVGPLSSYGFGYWWNCHTTITFPDGHRVETYLTASTVTPSDRHRSATVVERCSSSERKDCVYSREGSRAASTLLRFLGLLRRGVAIVGIILAAIFFLRGVLGQRLYARIVRHADSADADLHGKPEGRKPRRHEDV